MPNLSISNNALGSQTTIGLGALEQIKLNQDGTVEIPNLSQLPFRGIQVYDTPGTYTWTVPDGVTKAWVTVVGGGGGGGYYGLGGRGAGGGAGGAALKLIDLSGESSVSVTVGAGGASGSYAINGAAGGASSFGAFCSATGGGGGNSQPNLLGGGGGGTGAGGDVNINGGGGEDGRVQNSLNELESTGAAGNSIFGGAGKSGSPHGSSGSKGGGAGGSGRDGGFGINKGGDGIVIIQW